ncbi:MAG: hypothetical protein AB1508_15785 [Pseudomonadota bacterium]
MNMGGKMQVQSGPEIGAIDDTLMREGIEEIIAEHGGDERAAIRSLMQTVSYLEAARDRAMVLVSYGYGRGRVE